MTKRKIITVLSFICVVLMLFTACSTSDLTSGDNVDKSKEKDTITSFYEKLIDMGKTTDDLYEIAKRDIYSLERNLTAEREELLNKINSYDAYIENESVIEAFYNKVNAETEQLIYRIFAYTVNYANIIVDSDSKNKYEDCEVIYDDVYENLFDEVYDITYDGILNDLYDDYYDGVIDNAYDDLPYKEWSDTHSDAYRTWSDAHSDCYRIWSDGHSDVYRFWSDLRSDLYSGDVEAVRETIADFKEDIAILAWNSQTYELLDLPEKAETTTATAATEEKIETTTENTVTKENATNKVESTTASKDKSEVGVDGNFKYKILDNNSVEIIEYTGSENEVTIPSEVDGMDVTAIGESVFEDYTQMEEVIIWADIEVIGDKAFKGCTALEEISISSENEMIGKSAFEGCTALKDVILWGGEIIDECAFKGCISLKEISIPSEIEVIGKSAFENCTSLKDLTIWGTEAIDESAFKGCISLEEVSIPSEVETIGNYAFYGCTSLEDVTIWDDGTKLGTDVFGNCPNLRP